MAISDCEKEKQKKIKIDSVLSFVLRLHFVSIWVGKVSRKLHFYWFSSTHQFNWNIHDDTIRGSTLRLKSRTKQIKTVPARFLDFVFSLSCLVIVSEMTKTGSCWLAWSGTGWPRLWRERSQSDTIIDRSRRSPDNTTQTFPDTEPLSKVGLEIPLPVSLRSYAVGQSQNNALSVGAWSAWGVRVRGRT